jgi:hypothetical protein
MTARMLWLFGIGALCIPAQVPAIEVLSANELRLHCNAFGQAEDNADVQYCIRYVQGFIDGAVATDARVMINVEASLERKETFAERAARTRTRSARERAAEFAEFCLGDPVPLREVVEKVVADLNQRKHTAADLEAREALYASLRNHYPCKTGARQ